jgi:two-component system NarL family response regulator
MCLLDVHMPGGGIWAVAQIVRELPDTPIVMVTVSDDNAELFAALQAGAWGYLLKDIGPEALADELHAVLRGEAVLPATLTASLIEEFRARGRRTWWQIVRAGGVRLTSREFEIAECLREGLSTQEIARKLDVSPVTVRRHVGAVLRKLGVADRAGAQELLQGRSET